jgi:hypothetical protein
MALIASSGNDSLTISNYIFQGLADGNVIELTFPNDIAAIKVGKNGNAMMALNESGQVADAVIRVIRGSADDQYLLGLQTSQNNNFAGFVLMQGTFVKSMGDGAGNILSDTYVLAGGVFSKLTEAKSNVEGDTEQNVAIYHLKFAQAIRIIS